MIGEYVAIHPADDQQQPFWLERIRARSIREAEEFADCTGPILMVLTVFQAQALAQTLAGEY